MKKIIISSLCLLVLTGCSCSKQKKEDKVNEKKLGFDVNVDATNDAEVDGLLITNVNLITDEERSTYTAIAANKTDDVYNLKEIVITFKDKDEKEIKKLNAYIGDSISIDEKRNIYIVSETNLKETAHIDYEIVR